MARNFTEECERAIEAAQRYAMRKGGLLGTEHLLAGLASADCAAAEVIGGAIDPA